MKNHKQLIASALHEPKKIKKKSSQPTENGKLKGNLQWYRKQKQWSQEKMADHFNLTRGMIASYELGTVQPGIELLCEICRDLHVYLHEFIEEDLATYTRPADQPPAPAQLAGEQSLDEAIEAIQQGLELLKAKSTKNRGKKKG